MKLPWNRKYLEICFHVVLTAGAVFLLWAVMSRLPMAKNVISETAGKLLAVFSPFFWALGFAVLLEPLTAFYDRRFFHKRGKKENRKKAAAAAYLTVGVLLGGGLFWLVRRAGSTDLEKLAAQAGDLVLSIGDLLVLVQLKLAEFGLLGNLEGLISEGALRLSTWLEGAILGAAAALPRTGGYVLDAVIGFTAAFYFLMEKEQVFLFLREVSDVFFGERFTKTAGELFGELYGLVMGYLSGQILDAVIMGVLFAAVFWIIGIPYGIWIGLLSGFSNLIPYFGAIMAFLLAVLSGLFSGAPIRALFAAGAILLLQQLDSAVIVPKVLGKRVEMHPVLVLLSLSVFGGLFGFWGLVWAVPLGAFLKNLFFRLYFRKRRKSL